MDHDRLFFLIARAADDERCYSQGHAAKGIRYERFSKKLTKGLMFIT